MLSDVKQLLGFTDGARDDLLSQIIDMAEIRLRLKLGGPAVVPDSLRYIVSELAVIRYNRISSEGAAVHSIDGESVAYLDDDFAPFENDIAEWKRQNGKAGRFRFI